MPRARCAPPEKLSWLCECRTGLGPPVRVLPSIHGPNQVPRVWTERVGPGASVPGLWRPRRCAPSAPGCRTGCRHGRAQAGAEGRPLAVLGGPLAGPHWYRPSEVDQASLRRFIEAKLAEELSPATVRLFIMLLSAFFGDLVEQGHVQANPVRAMAKSARRLIKPNHDPRTTPFVEKLDDVRRIYLLPEPVNIAYALGAMAGLRTGEVLALRWEHVDIERRRIHVRESVNGRLKDNESRVVLILDGLHAVLAAWKLRTGGKGTVVPPMRSDGKRCDGHTVGKYLRKAVTSLHLPKVTWYQATRHTFASHWVLSGGSIEKLKEMLGHCSVVVTERYAHLKPELFAQRDFGTIALDLTPGGVVTTLQGLG